MKLIYVGNLTPGSRSEQRRRAFERLGHQVRALAYCETQSSYADVPALSLVDRVRHRLGKPSDPLDVNRALLEVLSAEPADLVWVDKAPPLRPQTLAQIRRQHPGLPLVFHSEDNHALKHNQWRWMGACFEQYHVVWTTKKRNVERGELAQLGARDVRFHFQSFDPLEHRPVQLSGRERDRYFADAGFIGTYEAARAKSILRLAESGVFVRVFGNGWQQRAPKHALLLVEPRQITGHEYLCAMAAARVQLGFLRKSNLDEHTSRSLEIPACGVPLVAERTGEHTDLFEEGREALFFADDEELVEVVQRVLSDGELSRELALNGRERCLSSGYDHDGMLARCLVSMLPHMDPAPALEGLAA